MQVRYPVWQQWTRLRARLFPVKGAVLLRALARSTLPTIQRVSLLNSRANEADLTAALVAHRQTLTSLELVGVGITQGSWLSFLHSAHDNMQLKQAYSYTLWSNAPGKRPFEYGSSEEFEGYDPAMHVKFGTMGADGQEEGYLLAPRLASMNCRAAVLRCFELMFAWDRTSTMCPTPVRSPSPFEK